MRGITILSEYSPQRSFGQESYQPITRTPTSTSARRLGPRSFWQASTIAQKRSAWPRFVRTLSEESRRAFTKGNRFETLLPDAQTKLTFKLFTSNDERQAQQLRRAAGDRFLSVQNLSSYHLHVYITAYRMDG